MTALISARAQRDLQMAIRWISKDNPIAARGLRDAVERAARQIGEHPLCGTVRPALMADHYRLLTLTGFPYVIIYNAERSPPVIIRVLHGVRDLEGLLRN